VTLDNECSLLFFLFRWRRTQTESLKLEFGSEVASFYIVSVYMEGGGIARQTMQFGPRSLDCCPPKKAALNCF